MSNLNEKGGMNVESEEKRSGKCRMPVSLLSEEERVVCRIRSLSHTDSLTNIDSLSLSLSHIHIHIRTQTLSLAIALYPSLSLSGEQLARDLPLSACEQPARDLH